MHDDDRRLGFHDDEEVEETKREAQSPPEEPPRKRTVRPEEVGTGRLRPPSSQSRQQGGREQAPQQPSYGQSPPSRPGGSQGQNPPPFYGQQGAYGQPPQPPGQGPGGPRMMSLPPGGSRGSHKGIYIMIAMLIVFLLFVVFSIAACSEPDDYAYSVNEPYIAVVYVEGSITTGNYNSFGQPIGYQHYWTLDQIDYLASDHNNKAIMLVVDSPGGGVYESDELYLQLKEYQEQTQRPVYAVMESYAASGGYYISAAADKIYANRNTWTGSIGVTMGTFLDISEFLENWGIKTETITSGENKAMGSTYEPMTDAQRAIFQSLIDEAYEQFVGIVAEERELPLNEAVRISDGRIYTAKQALELDLIDEIGDYAKALNDLRSEYSLKNAKVVHVTYETKTSFLFDLLYALDVAKPNAQGELGTVLQLIEEQNKMPISYMCEFLD